MEHSSSRFWQKRYTENRTGWDLGDISPPIRAYFDQVKNRELKILFPGCGNAYEAEYLHQNGFTNIYVLDFAEQPLLALKQRCSDFPADHIISADFFNHKGSYDIIVEQTFFSAIDPSDRQKYAQNVYELLKPGGKYVGVLFDVEFPDGPPFGGSQDEYRGYFELYFSHVQMEPCYNSISPRSGAELFIMLEKD